MSVGEDNTIGAANEEAPAINAINQRPNNENRAALEEARGRGEEEIQPKNENALAELFGDMRLEPEPLRTLDDFEGGVIYRSSLMPN